jgi:hypothetical protein
MIEYPFVLIGIISVVGLCKCCIECSTIYDKMTDEIIETESENNDVNETDNEQNNESNLTEQSEIIQNSDSSIISKSDKKILQNTENDLDLPSYSEVYKT